MANQPKSGETRIGPQDRSGTWTITTEQMHVFRVGRVRCYVLEMEDVHFHHNSAVMLPEPPGSTESTDGHTITGLAVLRACLLHAKANPEQQLLLAGHTDTSGEPDPNLRLSERRAQNVDALLRGQRDTWVSGVLQNHRTADYQQILLWVDSELAWGCSPGEIDDNRGKKTIAAIKSLQRNYNRSFHKTIKEDGIVGSETWGAMFDLYMQGLATRLNETDVAGLTPWRQELHWLNESQRFVGCGENHPIDAADRPNHRSEVNRRVELLFFEPHNTPPLDCHPLAGTCQVKLCKIYDASCYHREYIPCEPEQRTPPFYIRVIDENEEPLADEGYAIYLGTRIHEGIQVGSYIQGTLDATGRAGCLSGVAKGEPFFFEVRGRVSAIVRGALLLTEDPGVEYGGAFFDWALADEAKTEENFWSDYESQRKRKEVAVTTFWQHDHITRRRIRARQSYIDAFPAKEVVIQAIPIQIRVGPLIRHTSHDCATIWTELETPGIVRVKYRRNDDQQASPAQPTRSDTLAADEFQLQHVATSRVGGRNYAVAVLSGLEPETVYDYTLEIAPLPTIEPIPKPGAESLPVEVFPELTAAILNNLKQQLDGCSFRDNSRFCSFRTLRRKYEDKLRFTHMSCRKWPYDEGPTSADKPKRSSGPDMLEGYGEDILAKKRTIDQWPSFLLLSGDQIYADDLGSETGLQVAKARFAARIPGPGVKDEKIWGAWAGRFGNRFMGIDGEKVAQEASNVKTLVNETPKLRQRYEELLKRFKRQRLLGSRALPNWQGINDLAEAKRQLEESEAGMESYRVTSSHGAQDRPRGGYPYYWKFISQRNQHLMRFRQRINNHLLWKVPLRSKVAKEDTLDGKERPGEEPRVTPLGLFDKKDGKPYPSAGASAGMHAADFAEYAFLYERAWAHAGSWARKVLANIPSFMIFDDHEVTDDWNLNHYWTQLVNTSSDPYQMWPSAITDAMAAYWVYQGMGNLRMSFVPEEQDARSHKILDETTTGRDALPQLRTLLWGAGVAGEKSHHALQWHYELPISPTFLVADSRTRRRLARATSKQAIEDELSHTLDKQQRDWIKDKLNASGQPAAFLVLSTPLLLPRYATLIMTALRNVSDKLAFEMRRGNDFEHMITDQSWFDMLELLRKLKSSKLESLIVLSGDVHFSYNMRGSLGSDSPEVLQLVCSGAKQELTSSNRKLLQYGVDFFGGLLSHDFEFKGMKLTMGGLSGAGEMHNAVLTYNSVAVVDADFGAPTSNASLGKGIDIRIDESYYTQRSAHAAATEPFDATSMPGKNPGEPRWVRFFHERLWDGSTKTAKPYR